MARPGRTTRITTSRSRRTCWSPSSGSKPIEGVGTAVAAFVGLAEDGPFNEPTLVTNWTQFVNVFGNFIEGSYLAHAVYAYFLNGGGVAYVVRIGSERTERRFPVIVP